MGCKNIQRPDSFLTKAYDVNFNLKIRNRDFN